MPICATGRLRDVISAVMVPNGTEVMEVACSVGWEVLVLCGCWNVWIDKLCWYCVAVGMCGLIKCVVIVWVLECVN